MNKQEIEKAIDDLDDLKNCESISSSHFKEVHGKNLELAIFALTHQLTNGWIPVSERLPERRQHKSGEPIEFNIMLLGGRVPTTGCINDYGIWGQMDWERCIFNPIGIKVLYWRPLPEPPKEVN